MAFDGVFIHYLIEELSPQLENKRISKVNAVDALEYAFQISAKDSLIISCNKNFSCFYITHELIIPSKIQFTNILKKYFEGGFIRSLSQYQNDRFITMIVEKFDDLGYSKLYKLVFEATGKTSNIIILDENDVILDALHKHFDAETRIIQNGAPFEYLKSNQINPFKLTEDDKVLNENIYQGVSKVLFGEFCFNESVIETLNKQIIPTIIIGDRVYFSCYKLDSISGDKECFKTLNEMLLSYIDNYQSKASKSSDIDRLTTLAKTNIEKCKNKLEKQKQELKEALDYSDLLKMANLLQFHIYEIKPFQESITVKDDEQNDITIPLNPQLKPVENINYYFNKIKKQKRTIEELNEVIQNTTDEIKYYEELENQIAIASPSSLKEIQRELGIVKQDVQHIKPAYTKYIDDLGNTIYVGRNNIQNDYLTNRLAKQNDYFFHITSYPGCHVIFSGKLTEDAINLAANICAYHSKMTSTVSIDYVQIKYVKKVKGYKGSYVTYTNQKTAYANGDYDYIKEHAKLVN